MSRNMWLGGNLALLWNSQTQAQERVKRIRKLRRLTKNCTCIQVFMAMVDVKSTSMKTKEHLFLRKLSPYYVLKKGLIGSLP